MNIFYNNEVANEGSVIWQMRNPNTCYTGPVFLSNETGKIEYPKDVIIPVQTDRDREILPKFVVVNTEEISNEYEQKLLKYLEINYKKRNKTCTTD